MPQTHKYMHDYTERYQDSPLGGEIGFDGNIRNDLLDKNEKKFQERASLYHSSYLYYDGASSHTSSSSKILNNAIYLGYNLEITNVQVDMAPKQTTFTVANIGIAPVYKDMYVTLKGVRSKDTLKNLQQGESVVVVVDGLPTAEDEIKITSDWCLNNEAIPFKADLTISEK